MRPYPTMRARKRRTLSMASQYLDSARASPSFAAASRDGRQRVSSQSTEALRAYVELRSCRGV